MSFTAVAIAKRVGHESIDITYRYGNTDAYKKYARYKDKNLNQLMEFSKVARVEEKVRRYMEVLL